MLIQYMCLYKRPGPYYYPDPKVIPAIKVGFLPKHNTEEFVHHIFWFSRLISFATAEPLTHP